MALYDMLVPPQEQKVLIRQPHSGALKDIAKGNPPGGENFEQYLVVHFKRDMPEVQIYTHSWTVANGLAGWSCKYSLNSNLKEKELNNQVDKMIHSAEVNQHLPPFSFFLKGLTNKVATAAGTKIVHGLSNMDFHSPQPM